MAQQTDATARQAARYRTRVDLPEERRKTLVGLLNARLADATDLYTQTKQAHWNVKGKDFYQLHELFDELAGTVLPHVDLMAERATALGGIAHGTARLASEASSLPEMPLDLVDGRSFLEALVERYGKHANQVRAAIDQADELGDQGTTDLFTEVVRDLDKALYFLESHLQG